MPSYTVGDMIRELRIEKGYSQEELCEGICSPGNLSKIENNTRKPENDKLTALLQRLGRSDLFVTYSSKEEMKKDIMINNLTEKIADNDALGLERALTEISEFPCKDCLLHEQYIQFAKTMLSVFRGADIEQVLPELVRTIQITKKDFQLGKEIPKGLYTYNEIVIVNAIAVQCYRSGQKEYAISQLLNIRNYMNEKILDEQEKSKKYPMILLNLSSWLCNGRQYEEALKYAEEGLACCKKYKRLQNLPELLIVKGTILGNLSQILGAKACFVQARYLFEMLEKKEECEQVCYHAKKDFGILI